MAASKTKAKPTATEIESLEALLRKLPAEDQAEAFRILYGDVPSEIPTPADVQSYADEHDFEIAAYSFPAAAEQRRKPLPETVRLMHVLIEPAPPPEGDKETVTWLVEDTTETP